MPPKPKFTKEQIVETALALVAEKGTQGLTARELGAALGSSARPIFTVFRNMEEVQTEVRAAAMRRFEDYAADKLPDMPLFKQVGMRMVLFAVHEPKLFRLLFMHENPDAVGFDDVYGELGGTADLCVRSLREVHGLDEDEAHRLFEHVWVYTYGIAALCAGGVCRFSEDRLSGMLTTEFQAMLSFVKEKST